MNIQHCEELFIGSFLDNAVPAKASAVNNNIDGAEGFERGIYDLLRKGGLHQVAAYECDTIGIAGGRLGLLQCLLIQIASEHIGAS